MWFSSLRIEIVEHFARSGTAAVLIDPVGWSDSIEFRLTLDDFEFVSAGAGRTADGYDEKIVFVVSSASDASLLEETGAVLLDHDLQPSSILPGLNPVFTGELSITQMEAVFAVYKGSSVMKSKEETARFLLSELFHLRLSEGAARNEVLQWAMIRHQHGDAFPPSLHDWLVDFLKSRTSLSEGDDDGMIEALFSRPKRFKEAMKKQITSIPLPTAKLEGLEINIPVDPESINRALASERWDESLQYWLENWSLLGRLMELSWSGDLGPLSKSYKNLQTRFEVIRKAQFGLIAKFGTNGSPSIVHRVPEFIHRHHNSTHEKVAVFLIDGMSLPIGRLIIDYLAEHGYVPHHVSGMLAWVPSITSISRQALFAGQQPKDLLPTIFTSSNDGRNWAKCWSKLWKKDDVGAMVNFITVAEKRQDELLDFADDPHLRRLGIVFNDVDEMISSTQHIAAFNFASMAEVVRENWGPKYLLPPFKRLLGKDWTIYIASDHGFTYVAQQYKVEEDVSTVGRLARGERLDRAGERAAFGTPGQEVFMDDQDLERGEISNDEHKTYYWLAPPGTSFHTHAGGFAHGGGTFEEVIVPFIGYRGRPK